MYRVIKNLPKKGFTKNEVWVETFLNASSVCCVLCMLVVFWLTFTSNHWGSPGLITPMTMLQNNTASCIECPHGLWNSRSAWFNLSQRFHIPHSYVRLILLHSSLKKYFMKLILMGTHTYSLMTFTFNLSKQLEERSLCSNLHNHMSDITLAIAYTATQKNHYQ